MNTMSIDYIAGIQLDYLTATVSEEDKEIFSATYTFGSNASLTKADEAYAKDQYEKSIKYHWVPNSYYSLQPYIGDILLDICHKYNINREDIIYSGYNVFNGKTYNAEKLAALANKLFAEVEE